MLPITQLAPIAPTPPFHNSHTMVYAYTLKNTSSTHLPAPQVRTAYDLLDAFHHGEVEGHESVLRLLAEGEALREQQDLFELYVSDYVFLQRCLVRWGLGLGLGAGDKGGKQRQGWK